MPTAQDFRQALLQQMRQTHREGREYLEITAGELHRRVGGYPSHNHRMPACCSAMKAQVREDWGDRLVAGPPSGQGASLRIRYRIPRPYDLAPRSDRPSPEYELPSGEIE
jgi:hypothetical protein